MDHTKSKSGMLSIRTQELKEDELPSHYYNDRNPPIPDDPRFRTANSTLQAQMESLNLYGDEEEVKKIEAAKIPHDEIKRMQMQELCVERVAEMCEAVLFTIGSGPEGSLQPFFVTKHIPTTSQPKTEVALRKFASKLFVLIKCMEMAEKLSGTFSREQRMLQQYYDALFAMRREGCIFRSFRPVRPPVHISDHIVAVKITPLIVSQKYQISRQESMQDIVLLSPDLSGKTQRGCYEELSRLKAFAVKIAVESGYDGSKYVSYYVKQLGSSATETDSDYVKGKKEALLVLRLYEFYKESLLEQSKQEPSSILKSVISRYKLSFSARVRNLFSIKVTLACLDDPLKASKYKDRSLASAPHKFFPDTYMIFLLKYLQSGYSAPSRNLVPDLLCTISKAIFRREFESAISRLNNSLVSQMVKFRSQIRQQGWKDPLMVTVLLHNVFFVSGCNVNGQPVAPMQPFLTIRADGLAVTYSKGHFDENNNAIFRCWKPLGSIAELIAELRVVQNELQANFK